MYPNVQRSIIHNIQHIEEKLGLSIDELKNVVLERDIKHDGRGRITELHFPQQTSKYIYKWSSSHWKQTGDWQKKAVNHIGQWNKTILSSYMHRDIIFVWTERREKCELCSNNYFSNLAELS